MAIAIIFNSKPADIHKHLFAWGGNAGGKRSRNRIFPGVEAKTVQAELQAAAGDKVKVEPYGPSVPSPASPLRADVLKAFTDSVRIRHKGAPIVPSMSAGATDGLYFRATGMPVYGVDGTWIVIPDDERAHGRDERIPIKSFNENLDHWHDMLTKLAG